MVSLLEMVMAETKARWCFGDGNGRSDRLALEAHSILFQLKDAAAAVDELRRLAPGITQRMLTLQLRALKMDGIITRTGGDAGPAPAASSMPSAKKGWTAGPYSRRDGEMGRGRTGRRRRGV